MAIGGGAFAIREGVFAIHGGAFAMGGFVAGGLVAEAVGRAIGGTIITA